VAETAPSESCTEMSMEGSSRSDAKCAGRPGARSTCGALHANVCGLRLWGPGLPYVDAVAAGRRVGRHLKEDPPVQYVAAPLCYGLQRRGYGSFCLQTVAAGGGAAQASMGLRYLEGGQGVHGQEPRCADSPCGCACAPAPGAPRGHLRGGPSVPTLGEVR
jgi:hypothetical protein